MKDQRKNLFAIFFLADISLINNASQFFILGSSTIFESRSTERAARTTLLPLNENSRAIASPIPEDAPVTITTLSLKRFFIGSLYKQTILKANVTF